MVDFVTLSPITTYLLVGISALILLVVYLLFKKNNSPKLEHLPVKPNQYKNLIQNAIDIIYEADPYGNFTFANEFTIQHLGYSMDEIIGKPFTDFVPEDQKVRLINFYQDLITSKSDFPSIEFPIVKKDGSQIWGSQKVIIHRDDYGKISGYSGIIRDITILKNLESNEKARLKKVELYNTTINLLSTSNFSNFSNFNDDLKLVLKQTAIATNTDEISYSSIENDVLVSETCYILELDKFKTEDFEPNAFLKENYEFLKERKIVIITNLKESNLALKKLECIDEKINSMLIITVYHNGNFMGVLSLSNKEIERNWDNEDTTFIRTITDIISLGIELRLRLETERKLNYTSHVWAAVSKCTEEFLLSKSTYEMFTQTFNAIGRVTGVDHMYYYENNLETQKIRQKYKWAKENIRLQITPLKSFTHEELYQIVDAAKSKKPFISITSKIENSLFKNLLINNEIKSIIIIPLFMANEFSGYIGFDCCSSERVWTEEEINIFQVLANNISSVIERSTKEKLVNESEERFRLLANNIPGTVYLSKIDEDWTKVYLNDEIENLTGYPKDIFLNGNMSLTDLVHEDDREEVQKTFKNKIDNDESIHVTFRIRKKDNTIVWVEEFADIIKVDGKAEFMEGLVLDITEKRLMESSVIEKELAQSANKAKSEFLANMSHEIKTPLNGIIGFTDLIMQTNLDVEQKIYMTTVNQSANTLLGIIDDILDFSKIEAGKLELDLQNFSVLEVIESVHQLVRFELQQKKINLEIDIDEEIPSTLVIDPLRMKQILLNLVSNAIKFTDEGTITIKLKLKEKINSQSNKIRFSVEDSGIGILPENLKKIFQPFLQEDSSTTRKYGGTGLGLTITNQLLKLMKSKLKVKSDPNNGSQFYFDLVLKESEAFILPKSKVEKFESAESAYDTTDLEMKILIAEDNKINMLLIKTILKGLFPKAELFESQNGEEAIDQFIKSQPHIILMDIQMPVLNGIEATKKIRALEINTKIPIIAVTAGTLKEDRELCLASGMNDFVTKPIVKDMIKEVILKWRTTYKN